MAIKLDRLALSQRLKKQASEARSVGGLYTLSYQRGIYIPKPSDKTNSGLMGKIIQDLVGPGFPGPRADFGDCELKTYGRESACHITLQLQNPADAKLRFEDSQLFGKICRTVLVEHFETGKAFKGGGAVRQERELADVTSFDLLSNEELFRLFEEDYKSLMAGKSRASVLVLDQTTLKKPVWRLNKSYLGSITASQTFADNPDFILP